MATFDDSPRHPSERVGDQPIPRTVGQARSLSLAETPSKIIYAAAKLAAGRGRDARRAVGLRDLIAAAVGFGEGRRRFSKEKGRPISSSVTGSLAERVEALAGRDRLEALSHASYGEVDEAHPLSPLAQLVVVSADRIRQMTSESPRIESRHLVAALIDPPNAPALAAVLGRMWSKDWGIAPSLLKEALLSAIESAGRDGERPSAWRQILGVPRIAPAAFAADAPAVGDDALGRRADARRLAELVCLKSNAPPLAIGLFGDWGSGKSTFMAMIHQEVKSIGSTWRQAGEIESPFAVNVAQVRFNAWSFADSNLWASLAVEIFEGLRDEIAVLEGSEDAQARRLARLLAEISTRNEQAQQVQRAADDAVTKARRKLKAAETELREVDDKLRDLGLVSERVSKVVAGRHDDIAALLRDLGAIGQSEAATIQRVVQEVHTLAAAGSGGFAAARRVVKLASSRIGTTLLFGVALAVAAMVVGAWVSLPTAIEAVATALAFLAPLAGRVVTAVNRLSPLLDAVEADVKAEADLRRERALLSEAREVAARELTEREVEAANAVSSAEAIGKAAATPQAMLRYFLNESDELRGYEREIGLLGRLRCSFEKLNDLMEKQADPSTRDGDLPSLDRIVLYIDDLDRLREKQVVKVLEAIGLLLQFRLFVVVVAVDARWLESALRQFYHGQLGREGHATPGDYLEKIFQVPFWLPRLSEFGEFDGLARTLMPESLLEEPKAAPASPVAALPEGTEDVFALDPDEALQPGDDVPVESRAAAVERVTLTPAEVEVLRALMPLAATGPRGAKRFVNLYRLARARRTGEELRRFLGEDGEEPGSGHPWFIALALLLACYARFDRATMQEIEDIIARGSPAEPYDELWTLIRSRETGAPNKESTRTEIWTHWGDKVRSRVTRELLRDVIEEASRYSFSPSRFVTGATTALDRAAAPANPAADQPGSTA